MDNFIRNHLSISSSTDVADVKSNIIKLLDWLSKLSPELPCNYNDVETLVKGAFYIDECFSILQYDLKQTLIEDYPFYRKAIETFLKAPTSRSAMRAVCNFILLHDGKDEVFGTNMRFILENLLKYFPGCADLLTSASTSNDEDHYNCIYNKDRRRMTDILRKIFKLPRNQIDEALSRMLDSINFDIIGLIFCESLDSESSDDCLITSEWICNRISQATISNCFIDSICITISSTQRGKNLFLKCLENQLFLESLLDFLLNFLLDLSQEIETEDDIDIYSKCFMYKDFNVSHILFLVHYTLHIRSPCRIYFYKKLFNSNVSKKLVKIINKMNFIFD